MTPVPARRHAETEWRSRAACRGTGHDLFFPARGAAADEAKAICADCPVRPECARHALDAPEPWGCWGGLSERDRVAIRAGRKTPQEVWGRTDAAIRRRTQRQRALEARRQRIAARPDRPPRSRFVAAMEEASGWTLEGLRTDDRSPRAVEARRVASVAARDLGATLTQIGRLLDRDHTTVLSALRKEAA